MGKDITCAKKQKWRSVLCLLMMAALIFAFAACGSSAEEDETETATQTDAEEAAETSVEEDTSEAAEDSDGVDAEDSGGEDAEDSDSETAENSDSEDSEDGEAADEKAADGQESEETESETTTEAETTTRSEAEVGTESLTDGTVAIDGYEVSLYLPLPDAWEEYELDGEMIYVSEDYPLSVPNISVYAAENDGSLAYTTQEIIEEVCEETFVDMSFEMGEFENTTISGYDAVIYSYSIVTGETEITQYYVLVETEQTLFRVTFTDSGDAYADAYEECIAGIAIY